MKSSNLKRLCYVVLVFILAFSMSSCKREDIVSDTVVDSTESTSLCETESATENVDESFSADSEPASELRSIEKNSAKQKHIKNDNGTVKETDDNNNVGTDAEQIENNTANTYTLSITCINAVNYANSHNMSLPAAIPSDRRI